MKFSARNQFKGKIIAIEHGVINGIVKIEIAPGVIISSSITMASITDLNLEIGMDAYAIIKATNVMVGIDED